MRANTARRADPTHSGVTRVDGIAVAPRILGNMTVPLTAQQVRDARMASLLLGAPEKRTPLEVVQWFGAMQAQDIASGHWSLGVRCAGATEADVIAAFEAREIVRTWPMRGTIHAVPAEDIAWMLDLMGSRALATAPRRREQLGLTLADVERGAETLAQALREQHILTRAQALARLADAGLDVSEQRSYHLLWYAAQIGVTCIGPQRGADQTFVLVEDWAPTQVQYSRAEALAELFHRFVRSHGPVGIKEFAGWTGLNLGDTKTAAAANIGRLEPVASDVGELWATTELAQRLRSGDVGGHAMVALPGFDEFMLGYKDRTLHVPDGAMEQIVPGGNGMFRATVVADGMAVATWKRTLKADRVIVEVDPIARLTAAKRRQAELAFVPYAHFLGKALDVRFTP